MARRLTPGIEVDRLDQEIKDLGIRVKLYKSSLVPDMTSLESIDQDLNENVSNNNMIDFDPEITTALFQQQDLANMFKVQGTFNVDEVFATFLSGKTLAPFARIEILDFEEDFFELIQRQPGRDFDVLKYKACEILGVFTSTTNTLTRYHKGVDFNLDVNGNINWIGTHRPSDDQIYTIYYRYNPVYRAVKAVHRERFSQFNLRVDNIEAPKKTIDGRTYVKLPETWILQRDYLLERRDNQGNLLVNEYSDPNS